MSKVFVTRKNTGGRPNKLSEETIDCIVVSYNQSDTQKELAERYGVSRSTIQRVLRQRRPD